MSQLTNEAVRGSKRTAGFTILGLTLAASAAIASPVQAGASPKSLQTFGTGDVTPTGDSATIVNDAGEYGGVYVQFKNQNGKALSQVDFQFVSTGDVAGGAPRFSLPIDTDGDTKTVEGYAFIDAANCGGVSGGEDVLVSTNNAECLVYFGSDAAYANWDAFAAANPTYRTARATSFIIADVAGSYAVDGIVLR